MKTSMTERMLKFETNITSVRKQVTFAAIINKHEDMILLCIQFCLKLNLAAVYTFTQVFLSYGSNEETQIM